MVGELKRNVVEQVRGIRDFGECPEDEYWDLCPRCGQEITAPFMQWSIPDIHDLYFHIKCAESLILALKRDVIEYRHGREFAQSWFTKAKESTAILGPSPLGISSTARQFLDR